MAIATCLILAMVLNTSAFRTSMAQGAPQRAVSETRPAPRKGVDLNQGLADADPLTSIFSYNISPGDFGLETREGSIMHVHNAGAAPMLTLMNYEGDNFAGTDAKLFGASSAGLYDLTSAGDQGGGTPTLAFGSSASRAGRGVFCNFNNAADAAYIKYADGQNGLPL